MSIILVPRIGIITRNTTVKYQSFTNFISKDKVSERITKLQKGLKQYAYQSSISGHKNINIFFENYNLLHLYGWFFGLV